MSETAQGRKGPQVKEKREARPKTPDPRAALRENPLWHRLAVLGPGGKTVQAKSASGTADDPLERETDRAAARLAGPVVLRQGSTSRLQSLDAGEGASEPRAAPPLLVDDDTQGLAAGQVRKGEFLAEVRAAVCREVEEVISSRGRSTADCPYLDLVFAYYRRRSARDTEAALRRFAPEPPTTAASYIPLVSQRAREAAERWVSTGEVSGLPEGIPTFFLRSSPASAPLGGEAPAEALQPKRNPGAGAPADADPEEIQVRLGAGRPLEGDVRARMEPAFGADLSQVRTHADTRGASLSRDLQARAFTVGDHVAFGAGEYRPGTLSGDALIAHELTHVLQQRARTPSLNAPTSTAYGALEQDADRATAGAIASLWQGALGLVKGLGALRGPNLTSGLRLQRCKEKASPPTPAVGAMPDYDAFSYPNGKMKNGDATLAMIANWEQLDRVYADADAGNARAKRFIADLEQTFAATGVYIAEKTAQPDCLIPAYRELKGAVFEAGCEPDWSYLSFLRPDKPGGRRLRKVIADAYEKRARQLKIRNEIIGNALNLLMAGTMIRGTLATGGATVEPPGFTGKSIESGTGEAIVEEGSTAKAAKTAKAQAAKAATGEAAAESALSKALAELRLQQPAADALSDAALARVMAKGRAGTNVEAQIQAMKGQLLEEIGEVDIAKMMRTKAGQKTLGVEGAKGTPEFIPGHSIRLGKEQFTDGVIGVKDPASKTIEARAIVEAKAGGPSSAGLAKTSGTWNEATARDALGAIETDLTENAAMREQFFKIHKTELQTFQGGKFNTVDKLKNVHISDLEAMLDTVEKVKGTAKQLGITQVEKGGQFSKDIERIYQEGGAKVQLTDPATGAVEEWTLKVSPRRTKMIGVLPGDVAATKGAALKAAVEAAKPFSVEILPVKPTEPQLKAVAEALKKLVDRGF